MESVVDEGGARNPACRGCDRMEVGFLACPRGAALRVEAKRHEVCAYDRGLTTGGGALV